MDTLDEEKVQPHAGGCINVHTQVFEAIKKQLAALGHDRQLY